MNQVLEHSFQIAQHLNMPLGLISESSAELAHLRRKNARSYHTRKTSAKDHMEDLITWDLARTDPLIAKKSHEIDTQNKYNKTEIESLCELPPEARDLLDVPEDMLEQI